MESENVFEVHADFCRIFSNAKRLEILWMLSRGEMSVGEIAENMGITMANVSQHLQIMRSQGAVKVRKNGRHAYYSVANENFIKGSRLIRKGLVEQRKLTSRALDFYAKAK